MQNKQSYIDALNTGRERRDLSAYDQLDHTLSKLEQRLDSLSRRNSKPLQQGQVGAVREQNASGLEQPGAPKLPAADRAAPSQSAGSVSANLDLARKQDLSLEAIARIADELNKLRGEFKDEMSAGLRREFEVLRGDIEKAYVAATSGNGGEGLSAELERIAEAVKLLAERHSGGSLDDLFAEIGTIKSDLGSLAREETLRLQDNRLSEFSDRFERMEIKFASLLDQNGDTRNFQVLAAQLDQVSAAIERLPASLPLAALESRLKSLTENFEAFAGQTHSASAQSFDQMAGRLDEINRAIAASSTSASVIAKIDNEPLDRIEARITTLSENMEALSQGLQGAALSNQIAELGAQIEKLVSGDTGSERIADLLNERLSTIAEKIDAAPQNNELARIIGGKIDNLASQLERSQSDMQHPEILAGLEKRLDEIVARLDEPGPDSQAADSSILRNLESQLKDISRHLSESANSSAGADIGPRLASIEASLVSTRENLEAQLADLSRHLSGSSDAAEFPKDLLPRLASIESSLESARERLGSQLQEVSRHLSGKDSENPAYKDMTDRLATIEMSLERTQETVLQVARIAAEEAIKSFPPDRQNDSILQELTGDLKDLETITRKSEERNTRTFEAIHDTLLKIVDHISEFENASEEPAQPSPAYANLAETPPLGDGYGEPLAKRDDPDIAEDADDDNSNVKMSPAEAAAAAAMAALDNRRDSDQGEKPAKARNSVFGGLSRAFSSEKAEAEDDATANHGNHVMIDEMQGADPVEDTASEMEDAPLEPGSGAPDLSAIMKRVRDEKAASASNGTSATAQSDFIAAARRAAQAAAAEADLHKGKNSANADKSGRFPVGKLLGRNRKLLLLSATAVLVLVGGYQLATTFLGAGGLFNSSEPAKPMASAPAAKPGSVIAGKENEDPEAATVKTAEEKKVPSRANVENKSQQVANATVPPSGENVEIANPAAAKAQSPAKIIALPAPELASPPQHIVNQTDASQSIAGNAAAVQPEIATAAPQTYAVPPEAIGPVSLRKAAESGDPKAMFEIANRYAEGHGVDADPAKAAEWYKQAAGLGLAPAQYRYGSILEKGTGIKRDVKEAMNWYRKAAEQGNASAMHNLAVLFAVGAVGPANNDSAVHWFKKAAELGVTDSQFNLGIMAAKGAGMPRNLEESYQWFALAAKTGDKDAAQKRDEVAKALAPDQLKKARAAVDLWKPEPLNAEANSVQVPDAWIGNAAETASVDMKKAIKNIQLLLASHGYDPGVPDGIMGSKTKTAISAYQKDNGLPVTGEIDEKLVRKLLDKQG